MKTTRVIVGAALGGGSSLAGTAIFHSLTGAIVLPAFVLGTWLLGAFMWGAE